MRTALTIVREHGSTKKVVVAGPEVSLQEQLRLFKEAIARSTKTHPAFAELELWTSDAGRTKYAKFSKPEQVVANPPVVPEVPPVVVEPPVVVDEPISSEVAPTAEQTTPDEDASGDAPASSRNRNARRNR